MKFPVHSFVLTALIACGLSANAASVKHPSSNASSSYVVEGPQQLPELAQTNGEALYLHEDSNGRTILYLEGTNGADLRVLDVTDPGKVRAIARVALPAGGPFDFITDISDSVVMIRYRRATEDYALLNLHKVAAAVITSLPAGSYRGYGKIGSSLLLLTPEGYPAAQTVPAQKDCVLIDTANTADLALLTLHGVKQTVVNNQTGTAFFLTTDGLTIVRNPQAEAESTTANNGM